MFQPTIKSKYVLDLKATTSYVYIKISQGNILFYFPLGLYPCYDLIFLEQNVNKKRRGK